MRNGDSKKRKRPDILTPERERECLTASVRVASVTSKRAEPLHRLSFPRLKAGRLRVLGRVRFLVTSLIPRLGPTDWT